MSAKQAEQFQNENKKGIEEAKRQMEKERPTYLGQFYDNGSDESEAIKKPLRIYRINTAMKYLRWKIILVMALQWMSISMPMFLLRKML